MTLFAECAFEGRKLDGMVRNGKSIVKQSKKPKISGNGRRMRSKWKWAL